MSYKVITEYGTEYTTETTEETKGLIRELTEAEWYSGEEFAVTVRNEEGEELLLTSWEELDNIDSIKNPIKKTSHHRGR